MRHAATTHPLLRAALETNGDEPSRSELEALAANLGIPLVPGPVVRPPLGASPAAGVLAVAKTKILTGLLAPALVGAMAGGAVWQATEPARTRAAPAVASLERPRVERSTDPSPGARAPLTTSPPIASAAPATSAPSVAPVVAAQRVPSNASEPNPLVPSVPAVVPPQVSEPPAPPLSEVELLERAKSLVDARPNDALALTAEHASRFPQGMLVQEAEVIAIEALVRADRRGAAEAKLVQFRKRFGGSAYLPRLESLVRNRK
jgi:hypothetical protein